MTRDTNTVSPEHNRNDVGSTAQDAATFFTVLAILAYPAGLLIFTAQLWTAYAYPLTASLYAAVLAPTAVAAFKVVHSVFWYFGAFFCVKIVRSLRVGSPMVAGSKLATIGLLIVVILTPLTTPTPYISAALGTTYIYT